jgi:hypothetical protein
MQKNFTQLIAHFLSTKRYTVPAGAFLLFLATSLYVWATIFPAPVNRSATVDQAANGASPAFVSIGDVVINEEGGKDFTTTSLVIKTNDNWRFNPNSATTVALTSSGGNIKSGRTIRPTISADYKTLTFSVSYDNNGDSREDITIGGMQVQPISGAVALPSAGTIYIEANANVVGLSSNKTVANLTMTHGAAKQVTFTTQPGSALINEALNPQPIVAVLDQFGNTVTSGTGASASVTVAIGNNSGGGTLSGTKTVTASGGVASFSDLNIDKAGTGYTLIASSGTLTSATSAAFTVNNPQPTISSISPCLTAGDPETTITITGSNFLPGASVLVNTLSRAATVVNSTTLTTTLTEAELTSAGNRSVVVKNPAPAQNNGESNPFSLPVFSLLSGSITGHSSVCVGQSAVNYVTSNATTISEHEWSIVSGDAEITSGGDSYSVRIKFGSTAGEVVLSVVLYNQCGDPGRATTKTITVNPLPTAELTAPNGTTACAGSTVALTAEPIEGVTYQWLLNGIAVTDYITDNTYSAEASGKYRVRVKSSAGCTATSGEVGVTIKANPTATIAEGTTATYCAGSTTSLTAQESGTGYTYQWYVGGAPIDNETARTLTVGAEGAYRVEVFRNDCSTMSEPTTVTELPLPTAEITPRSATEFCAGGSVILDATPGEGYNYRWFAEGSNTVLDSDGSFTTSTPGNYYVEVTGANGCPATSASVAVVVNQPPVATIEATGPAEFCAGQSVVLNAPAAPFGSTYAYEWYLDGGTTVIGANQSIEASESGTYTVKVTNTATGCESTSAGTVVKEGTLEFAIFTYSGATEFCEGGALQLDAILPPDGQTYEYRWFNGEGTTVATTRSYTVTTTGTYQVEITETSIENDCVKTSDPLQVTVNPQPTASIDGTSQSLCAEADNTTSFSVSGTFSGGTAMWSSNNTNFVIQDVVYNAETGIATATVIATGSGDATIALTTSSTVTGCNQAADAVVLNVKPLPAATITPQGPTTFCQGEQVILDAPEGTGYMYQWYLGEEKLSATGSSYTASLSGNYYVIVTSNGCPVQSPSVSVTVNPLPTATIEADGPIVFCEGGSVTLNAVSDIGTSFTWFNGTTQVGTGQTFVAEESGSYTVLVEAGTGCTNTSAAMEVIVNPTPDATITVIGETTFCQNESVLLRAPTAPAGQTYAYQWFNGSTQIAVGGTSRDYQATTSGNYTVSVTNTTTALNCSATTATPVTVTVNPLPTASISFTGSTILCQGSSLLLTGNSDTGTSYIWYRNSVQVATTPTYSATTTGSYTVRAINGNNCTSDLSAAVQVTVNPTITGNTIAANQTVCSGGSIAPLTQASGTSLAGGATPYEYQWQSSTNNSTWNDITTGGTAASYTPPVQTVTTSTTTYYRRIVSGGGCSSTSASVSVTVTPLPTLSFTGTLASTSVFYTGQSAVALTASPSGGTFSGPGVSGSVNAGFTFNPCNAKAGTHTITYTYKSTTGAQCSNSITKTVTVNQSTYRAIIAANPFPFCRGGGGVDYTTTVYRDVAAGDIIYPYLADANGQPVDRSGNPIPTGSGNFPIANDAYPFPEGTPESLKTLAYRFFQPVARPGFEAQLLALKVDQSKFTYQWGKNDAVDRKNDLYITHDAGLSSQDYYEVDVTSKNGALCVPVSIASNRVYSAVMDGYTVALSATPNPICQAGFVTFTAELGADFPWELVNPEFEFVLSRNNSVLHTALYDGSNTIEFTTDAAAAGGFVDGDQVNVRFTSDINQYLPAENCIDNIPESTVTIQVNDIITVAEPVDQSATVCLGGGAIFNAPVTTTGPGTVNYVWTVGGTTYPASTSPAFTVGSDITAVAGVYPVSVVVSNECGETTPSLAVGNLTVRDLASFTVTGGGSYCAYTPTSSPIGLSGSEMGVNYTLMRGTDVVETKPGTGEPIAFTAQTTVGTYTVEASYATESGCPETMTGSAAITATTDTEPTFGDLTVTWAEDNVDQWIVEASEFSELYGANPTFRWYTRTTGQTDDQWVYTGANTTNTLIVDNPAEDLEIQVEVFTTDGTCQLFVLTNIGVEILPVEIIYLNASKQGNNVLLEWATAMEQDNKGFEVQVSTDGFNYRLLTFVPSKNGNTSMKQVYTFTDKENGKHGTRYYRLKQIDNSGTSEFFGPKAVTFGSVASKIIAFPNPFHDEVTLDIASEKGGKMLIVVTDAVGKQLMQRTVAVEQGFTTEKLKLDASLPRGMYIIKTHIGAETQYIKLIKE